ncbi:hypothetical protein H1R20_g3824, partial [Candolleomyces eurysporus]
MAGIAPTTDRTRTKVEKGKEDGENTKDDKQDGRFVKFARFCEENPAKAIAGVGLAAAGTAVVAPALGVLALTGAGFTSGGVAAAAFAQSVFYGPLTGGLFSVLQSAGATAVMPSAVTLLTGSAATAAGAATLASGIESDTDEDDPSPSDSTPDQAQRLRSSPSAGV